jgi:hypothetical protein
MDKNYNELLDLMEDEFNYKLGFSEMSENKFLKFTGDWLLGKTEYKVPKNTEVKRIDKLFWDVMFGEEFMADKNPNKKWRA